MDVLDGLQQLRCLVIPAKGRVDPHNVLDREWVFLVLRLELGEDLLALLVPVKLHQTEGLDRIEKRILRVLLQTYQTERGQMLNNQTTDNPKAELGKRTLGLVHLRFLL